MKPLTIAYITETAPGDRHAWSGTAHYVHEALVKHGFTVKAQGPVTPRLLKLFLGALNKLSLLVFSKRIDYRHSVVYSKAFGKIFSKKLEGFNYDAVLVCGATEYGAYIKTSKPVFYVLDRTIAGALNYHTILSDLWSFSKTQSVVTDKKAMEEATALFFSSEWAAGHARKYYQIAENKIKVIPFGANMDMIPSAEKALLPKNTVSWKLLLIGTSWENKGADIACNTLKLLVEKGIDTSLTIVGCTPPAEFNNSRITVIPFADKNTEEGRNIIEQLYLSHHFFILPTRFDCTPIVFCEASAFGVPILSADTGGVGGHVREGKNGFLIDYNDQGKLYAEKISELISRPETYRNLCFSTRAEFDERLNWQQWTNAFSKVIFPLIPNQ